MLYMLWFSDEKTPLAARLTRVVRYFESKYGKTPTTCLLPMSEETPGNVGGISCECKANVLEGHMMVGGE